MPTATADSEAVLKALRNDFELYAAECLKITTKQGEIVPFELNAGQRALVRKLFAMRAEGKPMKAVILKARQIGFCLSPATRVLTADLRWVSLDEIEPSQEIVATDEMPPGGRGAGRKMRRAVVEAKREVREPAFRVTMDDGRVLAATGPHRFLCRRRGGTDTQWRTVETMRVGDQIRHITEPWGEGTYEDGWMGGFLDGEGCLRRKQKGGAELTVSQVPGWAYDRAFNYLRERGYTFREDSDVRVPETSSKYGKGPVGRLVVNRANELFRLIGQTRPVRFRGDWWEDKDLPGKRSGVAWSRVVSIEPLGERRMIDLQTSAGTFIAEGFVSHNSTLAQALTIWRTTLQRNHRAIVVAHDLETGGMLFQMGRNMWRNLPDDEELPLKPPVANFKRSRYMHFGATGADAWQRGDVGVDSQYLVSTASETESGRGGTYRTIHGSEVAMWPDIDGKATALLSAVPDDADTLVLWESTARGFNGFKDIWDDAVRGSGFIPFFWPWWKHEEYSLPFISEADRERFRIGDIDQSPYAEREFQLVDPGPVDFETNEHVPLTLEQLNWRRWAIANKCNGKLDKFNEEFPTEPEDAFLSTGSYVFEALHVRRIQRKEVRDPDYQGALEASKREMRAGAHGAVEVPVSPKFTPVKNLMPGLSADWKLWLDLEEDEQTKALRPPRDGLYVIGVDVSGGVSESEEGEPAFHAIQVIDHRTREQVAEYSSRVDPALLAEHVFLTAHFFNEAWLGIEITGGYGMPVARTVVQDWRYRFNYMRHVHDRRMDSEQDRLGWDTRPNTKPILLSLGAEIISGETSGIHSMELTREFLTYIRNDSGKTMPERGKFSDRLMAWLIAQQIAQELPLRERKPRAKRPAGFQPSNPITGYSFAPLPFLVLKLLDYL